MKKIILLTLIAQFAFIKGFSQFDVNRVSVKTIDNKSFYWDGLKGRLRAIVFLAPECPLSQQYTLPLKKMQKKYDSSLSVIGVFVGKDYSDADYKKFKKKYGISFDLIKDENFHLAKLLKATVTPQIFLLDNKWHLLYHGAIDNRIISLGYTRTTAIKSYVEDAINSYLNYLPINITQTKAIGCFIEFQ